MVRELQVTKGENKVPRERKAKRGENDDENLVSETVHCDGQDERSQLSFRTSSFHRRLTGLAGTFESVDDIERSNSLALRVFSVGNRVTDDVCRTTNESVTRSKRQKRAKMNSLSRKILSTPRVSS